jgi:4-hydroxybenzoate polyprenyltransferase
MPAANKLFDLIYRMLRLRTALLILLFVAIADAASKNSTSSYSPNLLLAVLTLAAWYIFGTSINDLADEAIDKINLQGNPNRPLINQKTTRSHLWLMSLFSASMVVVTSSFFGTRALAISLGALILSYIYSMPPIRLSYRGIIAPLFLPLGYVVYPFYMTFIANHARFNKGDLILLLAMYISFIGRIILKDFRDVKGDRKFGKRTFIVRHGALATCAASGTAWMIGYGLIMWRFANWTLLSLTVLPFVIGIMYCLRLLSREPKLTRQVQFVGLIGRLANGTALLILTALYYELSPDKSPLYPVLLVGMVVFNLQTAYVLYKPLFVV